MQPTPPRHWKGRTERSRAVDHGSHNRNNNRSYFKSRYAPPRGFCLQLHSSPSGRSRPGRHTSRLVPQIWGRGQGFQYESGMQDSNSGRLSVLRHGRRVEECAPEGRGRCLTNPPEDATHVKAMHRVVVAGGAMPWLLFDTAVVVVGPIQHMADKRWRCGVSVP